MLQVQIQDTGPGHYKENRLVFTWRGLESARTMEEVTLDCVDFQATTRVESSVAEPLLRFLEEIGSLAGDWDEKRSFQGPDEVFGIICFWCYGGRIHMEVSLDTDSHCPGWTVQMRMNINQSEWPKITQQFRDYCAGKVIGRGS